MISPIIFCTIVLGVGSVRKAAKVGEVGGLALGYFLVMSTVALAIGLVVGNLLQPGARPAPHRGLRSAGEAPGGRRPASRPSTSCSASSRPRWSPPSPRARCCRPCWSRCSPASRCRPWAGRRAGPARHRAHPAARLPHPRHDHVGGPGRRLRRDGGRGRRDRRGRAEVASPCIMIGFYVTCLLFVVRGPRRAAAAGRRGQHLHAAEVPGPRVPADPLHLLLGVGAAAADREDGAPGRQQARSSASPCRPATPSTSTAPRST